MYKYLLVVKFENHEKFEILKDMDNQLRFELLLFQPYPIGESEILLYINVWFGVFSQRRGLFRFCTEWSWPGISFSFLKFSRNFLGQQLSILFMYRI